jgi:hypothetical protein
VAEFQLTLTDAQRDYLTGLLETALKTTRVEEHRTRAPTYREHIEKQEELIVDLLTKLGNPPTK